MRGREVEFLIFCLDASRCQQCLLKMVFCALEKIKALKIADIGLGLGGTTNDEHAYQSQNSLANFTSAFNDHWSGQVLSPRRNSVNRNHYDKYAND